MAQNPNDKSVRRKIITPKLETNSRFTGSPPDEQQLLPTLASTANSQKVNLHALLIDMFKFQEGNNVNALANFLVALNLDQRQIENAVLYLRNKKFHHLQRTLNPSQVAIPSPNALIEFKPTSIPRPISEQLLVFKNEFILKGKLGKGGYGQVFKVYNKVDKRLSAIKVIKVNKTVSDKVLNEAVLLAELDNENIVKYFNSWINEGNFKDIEGCSSSSCSDSSSGADGSISDENIYPRDPVKNDSDSAGFGFISFENSFKQTEIDESSQSNSSGTDVIELDPNCTDPKMQDVTRKMENLNCGEFSEETILENKHLKSFTMVPNFKNGLHKKVVSSKNSSTYISGHKSKKSKIKFRHSNAAQTNDPDNFGTRLSNISSQVGYHHRKNKSSVKITEIHDEESSPSPNCDVNDKKSKLQCSNLVTEKSSESLHVSSFLRKPVAKPPTPKIYVCIQMELCDSTLREWIDNRNYQHFEDKEANPIDNEKNKEIFKQILDAVVYLHKEDVVHRDLKPSNIFFAKGIVKVGDFGLARQNFCGTSCKNKDQRSKSFDVGTSFYMSPEMKSFEDYNHKTDIYSMGVILYEMYTPFATKLEASKALGEHLKSSIDEYTLPEFRTQMSLVKKMIADNPEDRPEAEDILMGEMFTETVEELGPSSSL